MRKKKKMKREKLVTYFWAKTPKQGNFKISIRILKTSVQKSVRTKKKKREKNICKQVMFKFIFLVRDEEKTVLIKGVRLIYLIRFI